MLWSCISFDSYIKPQLVQLLHEINIRCISFDSYIKPQQQLGGYYGSLSCISFDSYIKPQHFVGQWQKTIVVYLLIPTSNHNLLMLLWKFLLLYIFWFLHQTTTLNISLSMAKCCISFDSYIKPQPRTIKIYWTSGCISFDSYIKPQLSVKTFSIISVVYLLIPTSNHNILWFFDFGSEVVYLLIPTSNHNVKVSKKVII